MKSKEWHKEYAKKWRAANKKRVSEYNKAYYEANKEDILETKRVKNDNSGQKSRQNHDAY